MPTNRINGIDLYHEAHGDADAEPLLLIQGFGGNAAGWALQIPDFAARFHVVAFDNRGSGRSDQPAGPYSMPQLAADAAGVLDALGIGRAHVLGHSMGGMIAQEFAILFPQRVRSLTLLNTTPGGPNSIGFDEMLAISSGITPNEAPTDAQRTGQMLEYWFTAAYLDSPGEGLKTLAAASRAYPTTRDGAAGQLAAIAGHDTFARLGQITAPTLVAHGADDVLIDARNATILAERIPNAELHYFPGLRHGCHFERPDLVNAAALAFLSRHATAQP